MKFTIYQDSRQGGRANNEDRTTYCYSRDALLMIVADGMGGHHYGEVAAQIAVQSMADAFRYEARPRLSDPFLFLEKAINNAHHAILDYSELHGMDGAPRTTCVACVVQDSVAYWAHAGDSRLYHFRDGRVMAFTRDHSRIRILLEEGLLSPAQAATHPDRNKIYSCLGGPTPPEIDYSRKTPLECGDVLLLCSDGLWGVLPADMLAHVLREGDLLTSAPALTSQAEQRGGPYGDNVSLVVVRWDDAYLGHAEHSISTQGMSIEEITTRMEEFGRDAGSRNDLTDAEIERAIEEIRTAIDKYTPKR